MQAKIAPMILPGSILSHARPDLHADLNRYEGRAEAPENNPVFEHHWLVQQNDRDFIFRDAIDAGDIGTVLSFRIELGRPVTTCEIGSI